MDFPEIFYRDRDAERDGELLFADADGNRLELTTYSSRYENAAYTLIFPDGYAEEKRMLVYSHPESEDVCVRVRDAALCRAVHDNFWGRIRSSVLQTDGPAWYYEQHRPQTSPVPSGGMMGAFWAANPGVNPLSNTAQGEGKAAEDAWTCPSCGRADNRSRFCPDCGTGSPLWTCPGCGRSGNRSKFCPDCGAKRPER